jgi:hypothetical protein
MTEKDNRQDEAMHLPEPNAMMGVVIVLVFLLMLLTW